MNVVLVVIGLAFALGVYVCLEAIKRLLARVALERSMDYQQKQLAELDENTKKLEAVIEKQRDEFAKATSQYFNVVEDGQLREMMKGRGRNVDGVDSSEELKKAFQEQSMADENLSSFISFNRVSTLYNVVGAPFYDLLTIPDLSNETLEQLLSSLTKEKFAEINKCMKLRNLVINHTLQRMKCLLKMNAHTAKLNRFPSLLSEEIISEGQYIEKSKKEWDETYLKAIREYESNTEQHKASYEKLRAIWGALKFKKNSA